MHNETEASIAKALKDALAATEETFASLARTTGYPASNLQRWLLRRPDQLTIHSILVIADALGIDGRKVLAAAS